MSLDLALTNRDARTGRYNFARAANGDVAFDSTQAYAVMTAVECRRNAYWADRTIGSLLFLLRNLTSKTPSDAEASIQDALLPLVVLHMIAANPRAVANPGRGAASNALFADVYWALPSGQQDRRGGVAV